MVIDFLACGPVSRLPTPWHPVSRVNMLPMDHGCSRGDQKSTSREKSVERIKKAGSHCRCRGDGCDRFGSIPKAYDRVDTSRNQAEVGSTPQIETEGDNQRLHHGIRCL